MKVWEFAETMRWQGLKNPVSVVKDGEVIWQGRMEELPHREKENRHPKLKWADMHLKLVHMEAKRHPSYLSPEYNIVLDVDTVPYPTV